MTTEECIDEEMSRRSLNTVLVAARVHPDEIPHAEFLMRRFPNGIVDSLVKRIQLLERNLWECAVYSGAGVSGGMPTEPDLGVYAVGEVKELHDRYLEDD